MAKSTAQKKAPENKADGLTKCQEALAKLDGDSKYETKSAKIRELAAQGYSRGEIAKSMGILYQHVRNVLITPLKRDEQTTA